MAAPTNEDNLGSTGATKPAPPALHPFFVVPDLGSDGDFEAAGIGEGLPWNPALQSGGSGTPPSDDGDYGRRISDATYIRADYLTDMQLGSDDGPDGDLHDSKKMGGGGDPGGGGGSSSDPVGDGDTRDHTFADGDWIPKDGDAKTGGHDYPFSDQGGDHTITADTSNDSDAPGGGNDFGGAADGGQDEDAGDSDQYYHNGDLGGDNTDTWSSPGDGDETYGLIGDYGFGDGGDHLHPNGADKDKDSATQNPLHHFDKGGDWNDIPADADSGACDSLMLLTKYPPPASGLAAASAIYLAQNLLRSIPLLIGLPGGEEEVLMLGELVVDTLGYVLKHLGVPPLAAQILTEVIGMFTPVSITDLLDAGNKAANALQPALTSVLKQNTIDSLKSYAAVNGNCLPKSCAQEWGSLVSAAGLSICGDGTAKKDSYDTGIIRRRGPASGNAAVLPLSSLAIQS